MASSLLVMEKRQHCCRFSRDTVASGLDPGRTNPPQDARRSSTPNITLLVSSCTLCPTASPLSSPDVAAQVAGIPALAEPDPLRPEARDHPRQELQQVREGWMGARRVRERSVCLGVGGAWLSLYVG